MKLELENFDWGWMETSELGVYHKEHIVDEIYIQNVYERFFEVEKDDLVLDIGASIGPFTYSILHKNPKKVFCVEPSEKEIKTLKNNVKRNNVEIINKAITDSRGKMVIDEVFGLNGIPTEVETITFEDLIYENQIETIDFLKTDCEGGEYDIFNNKNIWWIKNNVKKIVGEWHLKLGNRDLVKKFTEFRDVYLRLFPNHEVYSVDGVNIKWDLWNQNFLDYYRHIIIYIDNRG